jgi:hypothetical protein
LKTTLPWQNPASSNPLGLSAQICVFGFAWQC